MPTTTLSNENLTILLAGVIVMIVVITLIINVWIICRSGCWVCKKAPDFELNLPLATIPTDVPEIPPTGRPYQHDVAPPVLYAAVLPRSQRGNWEHTQPPVPAERQVDKAHWADVNYYPAGMTVIDDGEQSRPVNVTAADVNGQPTSPAQQQVITAEAAKNALYAAVLPRCQRSALTKPTCNEPLDEADEIENVKTTTKGLAGGTEKALNGGQVHSARRNKKLGKAPMATPKISVNPDTTVPSNECHYMNSAETKTTATTTPQQSLDAGPQYSTMPLLGNSRQADVAEPFYAEATEVNATGLMVASLGRPGARPQQPDPRGPGARTTTAAAAAAAGTTTITTTGYDADTGNLYANCVDVQHDFTKIV